MVAINEDLDSQYLITEYKEGRFYDYHVRLRLIEKLQAVSTKQMIREIVTQHESIKRHYRIIDDLHRSRSEISRTIKARRDSELNLHSQIPTIIISDTDDSNVEISCLHEPTLQCAETERKSKDRCAYIRRCLVLSTSLSTGNVTANHEYLHSGYIGLCKRSLYRTVFPTDILQTEHQEQERINWLAP